MIRWIMLLLLPVALLLAVACEEKEDTEETVEQADTTVNLTLEANLDGDVLTVEGTTDLPDAALIAYEVRHERLTTDVELPLEQLFAEGNMTVSDGGYTSTVDLKDWPQRSIEVWVAFQTIHGKGAEQPAQIIERFGELGENLEGPNVIDLGEVGKRVELTTTVQR